MRWDSSRWQRALVLNKCCVVSICECVSSSTLYVVVWVNELTLLFGVIYSERGSKISFDYSISPRLQEAKNKEGSSCLVSSFRVIV